MGFLQRLRSEVAPVVRCQPCPPLLRVDACQRCGGLPDRGAFGRGEVGRRARPETVRGLGLPERGPKGSADRVRHPAGHRALGEATRRTAARRDRLGEPQARVRARGTLATTLTGLATRIAKIAAYTYAFLVNRLLGRPQGRIKELWA